MKKICQKILLWHYRRLLRKYFLIYLRKGLSIDEAVWHSREIVAWLKCFRDIRSLSRLEAFLNPPDSSASSSQPQSAPERLGGLQEQ